MLKSMTGYGRAVETLNGRTITLEIKSVNHRYFDLSLRAPRVYGFLEDRVRHCVKDRISRGKIDVSVSIENISGAEVKISLNRTVLEGYLKIQKELGETYGAKGEMNIYELLHMPEVLATSSEEIDTSEITEDVCYVLNAALEQFDGMRKAEGFALGEDILERARQIETNAHLVETRSPICVVEYKTKLELRIKELIGAFSLDEGRIVAEAALYADKIAVAEETLRLSSHLSQLHSILKEKTPVGRKLDFLVQELNREVNTIGSKAADSTISRLVLEMKSEIEKIREQIQNIE